MVGKRFYRRTNVAKANKFYAKHYQPRIPADLGFYDLRVPETRKAQAVLAKEAYIDGFGYWHYWFSENQQLLQRPFQEVLRRGESDFPFCLAWAKVSRIKNVWTYIDIVDLKMLTLCRVVIITFNTI